MKDYWGADLPVKVGRENFDRRRYVYIPGRQRRLAGLHQGRLRGHPDRRSSSRRWATYYNFPGLQGRRRHQEGFPATVTRLDAGLRHEHAPAAVPGPEGAPGADLCSSISKRMNRTIFFGFNTRANSYFVGSELASSGLPQGKELEILNQYKDQLPPELFTQDKLPVYSSRCQGDLSTYAASRRSRAHDPERGVAAVRRSRLEDPGRQDDQREDRRAVHDRDSRQRSRPTKSITNPYINMLRKVGINATLRIVDPSQYVNRVNNFDFDMLTSVLAQSDSPGNEQRDFWSIEGRRHARLAQPVRHQEPGRRRAGRPRHLRHRPRRPGRRNPCARPRAAVELLRRAAVCTGRSSGWPTGTSSAFPKSSRTISVPTSNPGGSIRPRKRAGGQVQEAATDGAPGLTRAIPGSGGAALRRAAAARPAFADSPTGTPLHGLSAFGDLKYGPDFTHFDYVNVDAPKGGTFNLRPVAVAVQPEPLHLQHAEQLRARRAMRRRAWRCVSIR